MAESMVNTMVNGHLPNDKHSTDLHFRMKIIFKMTCWAKDAKGTWQKVEFELCVIVSLSLMQLQII